MPALTAIAGTAYLNVGGTNVALVGKFTYRPSSPTREMKSGLDGPHGFKSTPGWGQIKATLRNNGAISVTALGQQTNVNVTCQLNNGVTVVGNNMFVTEPPMADAEEGEIEITWEGSNVTEN
jgi:hypothetical protein